MPRALLTVVLATRNAAKQAELRASFEDDAIEFVTIEDVLGSGYVLPEDRDTFEGNAEQKAVAVCRATGLAAIGDDSGLEVSALGGRPGVKTARFARERATDAENNAALLAEMEEVDRAERGARFRCVLCFAAPWSGGQVVFAEGRCDGSIARTPRGGGGFGYDPLFIVDGMGGRVMAELDDDEKREVSHRARAARALATDVRRIVAGYLRDAERIVGGDLTE